MGLMSHKITCVLEGDSEMQLLKSYDVALGKHNEGHTCFAVLCKQKIT